MNYKEQLLTFEWQNKRLKIIKRDNFCCVKCGSKNQLEVHHKKYSKLKLAWQYPNSNFITVCKNCHDKIHIDRQISTFFIIKRQPKKIKRIEKLYLTLTKKELELQKRHDKYNQNKN